MTQQKQSLEQLFAEDRAHFMPPSMHAHDHASGALSGKIVTGAKGIRIEDHQGKSYIDAFAGLYCVNIGYGRTEVAEAIYEQAKKLAYYHTYVGHSTDAIIELSAHHRLVARRHEEGLLRHVGFRCERNVDQDRLVLQQCAGPSEQEEDHFARARLSRLGHRDGQSDGAAEFPSELRFADRAR